MNKLTTELNRLYRLPGEHDRTRPHEAGAPSGEDCAAFRLMDSNRQVRTMLLGFKRTADWERVANLCQAIGNDLELPAPAISVSGQSGYRLWLSLAEPQPARQAQDFLEALRDRYLADMPPNSLELLPGNEAASIAPVPAFDATSGKWSAFIDPSLGGMFIDEPGLEMAPNLDRQADMLACLKSMTPDDFRRALAMLIAPASQETADSGHSALSGRLNEACRDPKSFLLAVMNDATVSVRDRIEAARALLPYFESAGTKHDGN